LTYCSLEFASAIINYLIVNNVFIFVNCRITVFSTNVGLINSILLVVLVRLSEPVQVIDWKDSSPKRCGVGEVKPYSVTHSINSIVFIV